MELKKLRKSLNKTQEEVAKDLNLQKQTYQNYELNKRQPDTSTLIQLADYFHVTVDYLIGHEVPYLLDKSILTDKQNKLISLIQNLKDPLCEKVEAYIMGMLGAEENKNATIKKFYNTKE